MPSRLADMYKDLSKLRSMVRAAEADARTHTNEGDVVTFSVCMSRAERDRAKLAAKDCGMSLSALVREALDEYLDQRGL